MKNKQSPTESQNQRILSYLQDGYSITQLAALKKFGCLRLGARVFNLKERGHEIITDMIDDSKSKKRYASYRLAGVAPKVEKAMSGKAVVDFSRAINQVKNSTHITERLF